MSNIAYLQKTNQSSDHPRMIYPSSKAVDGNRNGYLRKGRSCSHTHGNESVHWWRVQFAKEAKVRSVRITNRSECCSRRLGHFDVLVGSNEANNGTSNTPCRSNLSMTKAGTTQLFVCQRDVVGKFLYIHSHLTAPLTLCEVEVFGVLLPSSVTY